MAWEHEGSSLPAASGAVLRGRSAELRTKAAAALPGLSSALFTLGENEIF